MNEDKYERTLEELNNLRLTIDRIEKELNILKEREDIADRETISRRPKATGVNDRDGTPIKIGDTVVFLTRGLFGSKEGVVYKVARNKARVTARDYKNNSISRAPHNLRVKNNNDE